MEKKELICKSCLWCNTFMWACSCCICIPYDKQTLTDNIYLMPKPDNIHNYCNEYLWSTYACITCCSTVHLGFLQNPNKPDFCPCICCYLPFYKF